MDEGKKRVLAIVAGILVARHLKTPDDLFYSKGSPRTENMIASAVQWADRIMRKVVTFLVVNESSRDQRYGELIHHENGTIPKGLDEGGGHA